MPNMCRKFPRPTVEPYFGMAVFTFAFNSLVMPQLVEHKVCHNNYNSTICNNLGKGKLIIIENQVQSQAARWMALLPLSSLIPGFFMILIIGPLSDVIGKKRLMALPPFVYFIQSLVLIFLCTLKRSFTPGYFFIPYCLTGVFGDNAGVALLSVAYIADVTNQEQRTMRLTILESAIFLATLGAALGSGALLSKFGFIGGFAATAIVNAMNFIYVVFILPSENSLIQSSQYKADRNQDYGTSYNSGHRYSEVPDHAKSEEEMPKNQNNTFELLKKALDLKDVFARFKNVFCNNKKAGKIIAILLVFFSIALIVNMGEVYMGILFLKHSPFNMKSNQIGYFAATAYALRFAGVIIIPYIGQRVFKLKDIGLVIYGFASQFIFFISIGLAVNVLMLYLLQIVGMGIPIHLPVLRSMISKLVDADQHGTAIAVAEAIDIVSSLVTSFLSNIIYSATVSLFSGFAMCILGMTAFVGLIGVIIFRLSFRRYFQDGFKTLQNEETVLLYNENKTNEDTTELEG